MDGSVRRRKTKSTGETGGSATHPRNLPTRQPRAPRSLRLPSSAEASATDAASIIDERRFILATRDTGYRSLAAAVAELIDNSLQARATRVEILVLDNDEPGGTPVIAVHDDGCGMTRTTLRDALRFGGSERFNDRTGTGRFGMGLPNSGVSHARRLDVFSWRAKGRCLHTYLDVDEVAQGTMLAIPEPSRRPLPSWAEFNVATSGTLVIWSRCDRLPFRRAATIAEKLRRPLGQTYRCALQRGVHISVNGTEVAAVDPLFRLPPDGLPSALPFGEPLAYEVRVPGSRRTSLVTVRFVELPVEPWLAHGTDVKRRHGIIGGAGVSILRAGREIDYGWFFMGAKRRENYDDWWRCEVTFEPELDELFGVTHSKQGIAPTSTLKTILSPDLEPIARVLNARVRKRFLAGKPTEPSRAVKAADLRDRFLPPALGNRAGAVRGSDGLRYRIVVAALPDAEFFTIRLADDAVVLTVNQHHPFHTRTYQPLCDSGDSQARFAVETLLLAAARARLGLSAMDQEPLARFDGRWSDAVAAFLE
jgi:hypothetical protein